MIDGPIQFADDDGIRWSVDARPAPRPDAPENELLIFVSDDGQRRACNGARPPGATWQDVEERVWRALLRYADTSVPEPRSD
jgi:hypothetical protein